MCVKAELEIETHFLSTVLISLLCIEVKELSRLPQRRLDFQNSVIIGSGCLLRREFGEQLSQGGSDHSFPQAEVLDPALTPCTLQELCFLCQLHTLHSIPFSLLCQEFSAALQNFLSGKKKSNI